VAVKRAVGWPSFAELSDSARLGLAQTDGRTDRALMPLHNKCKAAAREDAQLSISVCTDSGGQVLRTNTNDKS